MSQLFSSGGQNTGASASASVFPMNIQDWFLLGLTGLISLQYKGLSRVFSSTRVQKINSLVLRHSHPYMTMGKNIFNYTDLVNKVRSPLFNMLSNFIIGFLKEQAAYLQSLSTVILELPKIKSVTVSIVTPSICQEVMGLDAMILVFWMLRFKPDFSLSSFTFINRLFNSSSLLSLGWCHLYIWGHWCFSLPSCFQPVVHPFWHFAWCTLHIS